jgi:ATP-dependent HslUV protease ATP-binding subunit HslU
MQYHALLGTEEVTLAITDDAVHEVARIAQQVNESVENIGARRLQTVVEKLVEEVSFEAEERKGSTVTIDAAYVRDKLTELADDADLSKYIL